MSVPLGPLKPAPSQRLAIGRFGVHLSTVCLVTLLGWPANGGHAIAAETMYEGLPDGEIRMAQDRSGRIHVAVLGRQGIVLRQDDARLRIWQRSPIAGISITPAGDIWLARQGRILRFPGTKSANRGLDRTASFCGGVQPVAGDEPGELFASRWGEVWAAHCPRRRTARGMYEPIAPWPSGIANLRPACDDPFGNVWALTTDAGGRSRLAVMNHDRPQTWHLITIPGDSVGRWLLPCADDVGFVWTASGRNLLRVDPRQAKGGPLAIASPFKQDITAVTRVANRQIVIGFSDGAIRELDLKDVKRPQWKLVEELATGPIRALFHDRDGRLWAVSGSRVSRSDRLREAWHSFWLEQPRMPAGNHDHIFARIDDKLYTAGGKTYFGFPASQWVNLDHIWSYDLNEGTWQIEYPMLEPGKAYSGIGALDGELWLLGGLFRAGNGTKATRTVEIYNPRTRRIRIGPPLHQPLGQVVALTVGKRLFAIGGGNAQGNFDRMFSIGVGERAGAEPSAPEAIVQASGCVLGGKIYIAAGSGSKCRGLFSFDPAAGKWSHHLHPSAEAPNAPLCTSFEGKIWVMGGTKDGGRVATRVYSPVDNRWRSGPEIPLPVSWGAAADVRGRLMIAGGAYREPRVGGYFNSDRAFILRRSQLREVDSAPGSKR